MSQGGGGGGGEGGAGALSARAVGWGRWNGMGEATVEWAAPRRGRTLGGSYWCGPAGVV